MPGLSGETLCDLPKISSLRSIAEVKDFILKIVFVVNTEGFNLDVSAVERTTLMQNASQLIIDIIQGPRNSRHTKHLYHSGTVL